MLLKKLVKKQSRLPCTPTPSPTSYRQQLPPLVASLFLISKLRWLDFV